MIVKDKKLKRRLDKVPDKDKNGEPIFKIASTDESKGSKAKEKKSK